VALPSLQDGIDQAGSPVRLLWKPGSAPWTPEIIEPEYAGWRQEQAAWHDGVAIADLSHHMSDTFIEGPDATRLLAEVSANKLRELRRRPGQAVHPVLSLAVIDVQFAEPGTEVTVSWGEHPGHGTAPDADLGFPLIRAVVAPAPYSDHARTRYRAAG
jgi:hypothetical protein